MTENEVKEILETISIKNGEAICEAVEKYSVGLLTKAEFEQMTKNIPTKDELRAVVEAVEKQGLKLAELEMQPKPKEPIITTLRKHENAIKSLGTGKGAVGITFKANVLRSSITDSTIAQREPGVGQLPTLQPQLLNLFSQGTVGPNSNGVIRYIDQATVTRAAAPVAEAASKPEAAVTWVEKLTRIEVISEWLPVTRQALDDLDFMASEIDQLLRLDLSLAIDQQLYSGTGTSPQLRGVYTAAPAFTPTAGVTTEPNIYDLIAAVATDIVNDRDALYAPNVVLINPVDFLRLKIRKASNGHYVVPSFVTPDGRTIDGMQVIPTARVAANTLLVGDFRYGRVYMDGDITVEIGWQNDQFVKNMVTMLAEVKIGLLIRDVNANAFRKVTDITTVLSGMD